MTADTTPYVQNILDRLKGAKKSGKGWSAYCPVHENDGGNHNPSLSISTGKGGRVLLHCHAGCPTPDILRAIGLTEADLFPPKSGSSPVRRRQSKPVLASEILPDALADLTAAAGAPAAKIAAPYDYRAENGDRLYQVVRFEPKDFRQRRPNGNDGWTWNLNGVPRVLYRLPELLDADKGETVFIVEGEKDADNLRAIGLTATCNSGGAMKWGTLADDSALHGRRVVIIPDRDTAGEKHARDVASRLHGKAADVRIIDLGKIEGFKGKDVSDWIAWLDCKEPDELRAALLKMADEAPLWQPTAEAVKTDGNNSVAVVRNLATVAPAKVKWLWPDKIPLGKLTLLSGDPGGGKSLLTLDIAARISTGGGWPDAPAERFSPGNVILISAEDDVADTIVPRLKAAGANLSKIEVVDAIRRPDESPVEDIIRLDEDINTIQREVEKCSARLLVIDPITAYVGKTDDHKNSETRAMLARLAKMAAMTGCAVLAVSHLRKSGGKAVHSVLGSLAYTAAARMAWLIDKDKTNPEQRLFVPIKANIAKDTGGLSFTITSEEDAVPILTWGTEPITATADELLDRWGGKKSGPEPVMLEAAMEFLTATLADGPRLSSELFAEAKESGIGQGPLFRAKQELNIQARKKGFQGAWMWLLPDESPKATSSLYAK